jgi:CRISPR-associated exonuclease Cas4
MDKLPLSALNHFLFCQRRAALIHLEQSFEQNVHTVEGNIVHDRVDTPGYHILRGVKVLRAMPVWSDRLGLSGKCDVVEKHPDGRLVPVEFKKSKKKSYINDDVQVCAQGICLEESLGIGIAGGSIFFASSKHRREVPFTPELREQVERTAASLHEMFESRITPTAERKKACSQCSLINICLPDAMRLKRGTGTWFARQLDAQLQT